MGQTASIPIRPRVGTDAPSSKLNGDLAVAESAPQLFRVQELESMGATTCINQAYQQENTQHVYGSKKWRWNPLATDVAPMQTGLLSEKFNSHNPKKAAKVGWNLGEARYNCEELVKTSSSTATCTPAESAGVWGLVIALQ